MKARSTLLLAVAAAMSAAPGIAHSQAITGVVLDSATARPLKGAVVVLGDRRTAADSTGRYTLGSLTPGRWRFSLRALGYAPFDTMVTLRSNDTTRLARVLVRLPPLLDTVKVSAPESWRPGSLPEFEERRARGMGRYLTREELRKSDSRRFAEVLRARLPGIAFQEMPTGTFLYHPGMTPPNALGAARLCFVQVVLDGMPIYQGPAIGQEPPDFALLLTGEFDAVEYYSSPTRTPVQYRRNAASCGTIILWSRRK